MFCSRVFVYLWASPATLLGLFGTVLACTSGGKAKRREGVLEVAGGWPARLLQRGFPWCGGLAAITLGHVVLAVSTGALARTRLHERAHVRQFERWGPLMLVVYPLAGVWIWLRGGDAYRDNPFEREARAAERAAGSVAQSGGR